MLYCIWCYCMLYYIVYYIIKYVKCSKHLKSIADDLVIVCDDIVNVPDSVSANVANRSNNLKNTVSTNDTVSINSVERIVRYKRNCHILHTFLLVTILLFLISIVSYHYEMHRSKQKKCWRTKNIKMKKKKYNGKNIFW